MLQRKKYKLEVVELTHQKGLYEMYPDAVIGRPVEAELITDANRPQVGDDLQIIFRISWNNT